MDWLAIVWRNFRRDLPGLALTVAVVGAVLTTIALVTAGPAEAGGVAMGLLLFFVAIAPIAWIRHGGAYAVPGGDHRLRRQFAVLGLGCLWTAVSLFVGGILFAFLGIE